MRVFALEYNSCVHDSAYETLSLHMTAEGAEKARLAKLKQIYKFEFAKQNFLSFGSLRVEPRKVEP